ncbi:MAG: cytochrome c3 family protein [Deltaproteobacteria bacterium]|nr:cytochrome c3 family protein [Deltaproteobacteria bacterium]
MDLAILIAVSTIFASAPDAGPPAPPTIPTPECERCHGNRELFVDFDRFKASVHSRLAKMGCSDCHSSGFGNYPHMADPKPGCLDCHDGPKFKAIDKEMTESVHFIKNGKPMPCGACHSTHYVRPGSEMTRVERNAMCIHCHEKDKAGRTLEERHAWHPMAALHIRNATCIACHTKPEKGMLEPAFKHKILSKKESSHACEDCHSPEGKMVSYLANIGDKPGHRMTKEDMLKNFYMSGATRDPLLDRGGLALVAVTLLGALGHALLRVVNAKRRRKP